jgi:catechol 2,3-dioxygenase-like lactoylglutathione lyase family enzyme
LDTIEEPPSRLHHNAFVTKDQEATRAFYEDLIGLPLIATWSEADELFSALRVYCHTFFGLGDGSALAFFQFANQEDDELFNPELTPSPFRHIALKVTPDLQQEVHDRLTTAAWKPHGTFVLEHGYCRSLYTRTRTDWCWSSPPTYPTSRRSPPTGAPTPTRPSSVGSPATTPATTSTGSRPSRRAPAALLVHSAYVGGWC